MIPHAIYPVKMQITRAVIRTGKTNTGTGTTQLSVIPVPVIEKKK